jgi:prepilin-type N-terminal cleavage/methylation domain-containing protein
MNRFPVRLRGFTLIEMAIVLVVIALIAAGGVAALTAMLEHQSISTTEQRLDVLQQTIQNYAAAHGYLPCPADPTLPVSDANFGVGEVDSLAAANGNWTGVCTGDPTHLKGVTQVQSGTGASVEGMVPTKTLGLEDTYALDGWGYRIAYAVDEKLTVLNAMNKYTLNSNEGSITIKDDAGKLRASTSPADNLPPAAYVLVSFGGGQGGYPAAGGNKWLNTGSTYPDTEQTCHCAPDGSTYPPGGYDNEYVQRWANASTVGGKDNFVAITRFARFVEVLPSLTLYNSSSSRSCMKNPWSCWGPDWPLPCVNGHLPNGDNCSAPPCMCGPVATANQCPAGYSSSPNIGPGGGFMCNGTGLRDDTTGEMLIGCWVGASCGR